MAGSESVLRELLTARNLFSNYVYKGSVRTASQRLGIHPVLQSVETEMAKRLPGPNVTISAGNASCTFYNESLEEYRWFSMYPEADGQMPVLEELVERLEPDDDFWDIGGNIGIYSCFASTAIESGSIVVAEPHPKNAERIRTNLARNGGNGTVYRVAFGSERDELTFHPASLDVAGSFGSAHFEHRDETITVQAVPGDTFRLCENRSPPDVMKIDVEGAEYDVLSGLAETLSTDDCRLLYCDVCSDWNDVDDEKIYRLLREYGYDVEPIWEWPDGGGHYVRAEK